MEGLKESIKDQSEGKVLLKLDWCYGFIFVIATIKNSLFILYIY